MLTARRVRASQLDPMSSSSNGSSPRASMQDQDPKTVPATTNASDAVASGRDAPSFPIVAVGASAGGLAASGELLRELGAAPGVAVVLVHHLDPAHESSLVEIFSRLTPLSVVVAADEVLVEVDHVYVMPPNAGLLIEHGHLKVVPRVEQAGLHLPINRFFESLAEDRDSRAVGVVLSGTGFDGTEGIKAIKRDGGITLAQDASAEYGGMPESAIATGCVDFVLPPAGVAKELRRLAAHTPSLSAKADSQEREADYRKVLFAMREASGVDFTSYKHSTLRRRLERRLFFHGVGDLAEYLQLLQRDPDEVAALCEEALIHVTGFFRDPEAFDALRSRAFPILLHERPRNRPIRVWVPGCSTGEEVYSLAISLLEFLGEGPSPFPIKLFGTDLSLSVIEKARAGRYPVSVEAEVSPARLERFFSQDERGYTIRREVRDLCVFAKHDVARDAPFSAMDLVSCRNLMIYLGADLQERVVALLHYALKEPGFLLLGNAESVRSFSGFTKVDGKHKLFARTSSAPRLSFDFTRPARQQALSPETARVDAAFGARSAGQAEVFREADRLVLTQFAPPGVVVTDDLTVVQFRGRTAPFLEHAAGAASLDLLRTVREELRVPLRRILEQARVQKTTARAVGISLFGDEMARTLTVEVTPFSVLSARQFLVLFIEEPRALTKGAVEGRAVADPVDSVPDDSLQRELTSTRQYLESVIEQLEATNEELKAANEEIVSSNEELRSGNEELESAKEELQATNEELRTLNDEMRDRSVEATRLSDDLTNVLSSAEIPIVILGRDSRVRRFTPAAAKAFGLVSGDVGHPLSEVRQIGALASVLTPMVDEVLRELRPLDSILRDGRDRWQQLWVRPYKTLDGRVDGTVITARDIDAEKRSAEGLAAARKYSEDVVEAVREGLVVLDGQLRVTSANKAFLRSFELELNALVGRRLGDVGRVELSQPLLDRRLEELRGGASVEDMYLERVDSRGSQRSFLLNARRIDGTELYLLGLQDVTELHSARTALQRAELADIMIGAAEGILLADSTSRIVFANPAACTIFGYEAAELIGTTIDVLVPTAHRSAHAAHRAAYLAAPSPRAMQPGAGLMGQRKDGSPVAIEVTLNAVVRDGGTVVVAFVREVTKQRKVEADIQAYQERLQRMSFEAVVTEERERRRIAIDLHDRLGQALALAQIKLTSVRGDLAGEVRGTVDGAVELLEQAISDARGLMFELSPPVLYDLGLKAALGWLAEDLDARYGMKVEVSDDEADKPLDDAAKGVVFRAVRELLMNVLKHSQTTAAEVALSRTGGMCRIDVKDGGVGFESSPAEPPRAGFGLLSVREQISRLGGELTVQSSPHRGTVASVQVPLQTATSSPDSAPSTEESLVQS
jgi:two-component system, chemotaxis family, CheB/CheR fusion protein